MTDGAATRRDCPPLLEQTLLDGLLWHSKDVEDGLIRVNYYIREMYGDPLKEPNVWKSALATFVSMGTPQMFQHPVRALSRLRSVCASLFVNASGLPRRLSHVCMYVSMHACMHFCVYVCIMLDYSLYGGNF